MDKLVDLAKTGQSEVDELAKLVPMYAELAPKIKIHLLQSIVSSILVDNIFSQYFVGLSEEQSSKFNEMERYLSSTSRSFLSGICCRNEYCS